MAVYIRQDQLRKLTIDTRGRCNKQLHKAKGKVQQHCRFQEEKTSNSQVIPKVATSSLKTLRLSHNWSFTVVGFKFH